MPERLRQPKEMFERSERTRVQIIMGISLIEKSVMKYREIQTAPGSIPTAGKYRGSGSDSGSD